MSREETVATLVVGTLGLVAVVGCNLLWIYLAASVIRKAPGW